MNLYALFPNFFLNNNLFLFQWTWILSADRLVGTKEYCITEHAGVVHCQIIDCTILNVSKQKTKTCQDNACAVTAEVVNLLT